MYGDKMRIDDIMDMDRLQSHIRNQYITARSHPHLPLTVLNYTPKAAYEPLWDTETMRCRGLIIDNDDVIVGNCMPKFFNYGQKETAHIDLTGPVQVTDKLDGSMGTVCFYGDELVVATRGSFESDQALWAYNFIAGRSDYYDAFKTLCKGPRESSIDDVTAVVEIIYPENRIVVDYGSKRDVVLIGAIGNTWDLSNGKQLWISADEIYSWPGERVEKFDADSFEDALRLPPRENREGVVIYFTKTGDRVKIKQEGYLIAHRFISNLTPKNIWKALKQGKTLEDLLELAPDEFHGLVREIAGHILSNRDDLLAEIETEFAALPNKDLKTRKELATEISKHPLRGFLFLRLDERTEQMLESVWKAIEP